MENEIVPADKRHRRLAIVVAALMVAAGLLVLGVLYWHLGKIGELAKVNRRQAAEQTIRLVAEFAWLGGLSLVGMGSWFWWLGRRINRADRFPPPGMKVIKDTAVRSGARARTLAHLAQVAALLCVVAGTMGMWYLYRLAVALYR
jgi:cytochrome c-type biogenesis protein CcmH/NrfG